MRRRMAGVFVGMLVLLAAVFWTLERDAAPARTAGVSPATITRGQDARGTAQPPPAAEQWLAFQRNADGTVTPRMPPPPNENSRWKNPAKRVEPVFPATFDAPVRVKSGVADVSARPLHANNATAEIAADGSLIYRDAFPGCDVQYRCTEFKTEEFIIVRTAGVPPASASDGPAGETPAVRTAMEFAWSLDTRGLKPRITPAHSIELCDEQGVPRLRINPPDGKDADGKRLEPGKHLQFALNAEGVTLRAELAGFKAPIVIDPTWSSTGQMMQGRSVHTTTLLADGTVLAAGGYYGVTARLTSCETFSQSTGVWSATGSMATGRSGHCAIRLQDNTVLVVAGGSGSTDLASCEIYNPSNGQWTVTGSLTTAKHGHTATLLANGKVLVAGSYTNSDLTCELYDPGLQTWAATGSILIPRDLACAERLPNGDVLLIGGSSVGQIVASCEIYSVANGTWSAGDAMSAVRQNHATARLDDGRILVAGGYADSLGFLSSCEIYDQGTGLWASTSSLNAPRGLHLLNVLPTGKVVTIGGSGQFDVFTPSIPQWRVAEAQGYGATEHTSTTLADGRVLATGGGGNNPNCFLFDPRPSARADTVTGHVRAAIPITLQGSSLDASFTYSVVTPPVDGSLLGVPPNLTYSSSLVGTKSLTFKTTDTIGESVVTTIAINVTNTAPISSDQTVSTHTATEKAISLTGTDPDNDVLTYSIVTAPEHGTLTGMAPNVIYLPISGFVGIDSFTFKTNDIVDDSPIATVTINVTNTAPISSTSASPPSIPIGGSTQLTVTASDPDGDALSFSWDFGDGSPASTEQNPAHTYAAPGDYTATVTVTDSIGASTTASVNVHVGRAPKARFTTSDIVGFVGEPLLFDASFSTDPENSITAFSWNFGDGTPAGALQQLSHIYTETGTYTVTLTITDGEGLTATAARQIEVLPANQLGLFNSFIKYKVKWDRTKNNADSLTFDCNVNVGADTAVAQGTAVALEIAGKRYEGVLDGKLRDKNGQESWQVTAKTKKQSAGAVRLKFSAKKTSLGLEFNQAGATGAEGDEVSVNIPVRIEIAGRAFELLIDSEFKFGKNGTKASGSGDGPD